MTVAPPPPPQASLFRVRRKPEVVTGRCGNLKKDGEWDLPGLDDGRGFCSDVSWPGLKEALIASLVQAPIPQVGKLRPEGGGGEDHASLG